MRGRGLRWTGRVRWCLYEVGGALGALEGSVGKEEWARVKRVVERRGR